MLEFNRLVNELDPRSFSPVGQLETVRKRKGLEQGTVSVGDKMVAASIQLADLGIKVTCFGGRVSVMDEACALSPDPFEEPPESTDEPDLKDRGAIPSFVGEPEGVVCMYPYLSCQLSIVLSESTTTLLAGRV